uniref:Uncharacterized protein n=1 Tax=Arundo donax TaxID=35708 RepID=A0A0A8XWH9_ARUDO
MVLHWAHQPASTDIDAKILHGSKCYLLIPLLQPEKKSKKNICNPKSHGPCFPNPVLRAPNSVNSLGSKESGVGGH